MDVYRQFRRHLARVPGVLPTKTGKKNASSPIPGTPSPAASPSPSKSKGKQSGSDVQIGLQKLVISVMREEDDTKEVERAHVRLFVIPSTSGLAAGYSVSDSPNISRPLPDTD